MSESVGNGGLGPATFDPAGAFDPWQSIAVPGEAEARAVLANETIVHGAVAQTAEHAFPPTKEAALRLAYDQAQAAKSGNINADQGVPPDEPVRNPMRDLVRYIDRNATASIDSLRYDHGVMRQARAAAIRAGLSLGKEAVIGFGHVAATFTTEGIIEMEAKFHRLYDELAAGGFDSADFRALWDDATDQLKRLPEDIAKPIMERWSRGDKCEAAFRAVMEVSLALFALLRLAGKVGLADAGAQARWKPTSDDIRFTKDAPPVLGIGEFGFSAFQEVVAQHFKHKGGILTLSGPSGVGKGYTTNHLVKNLPNRDFQKLEQDWFMSHKDVRTKLIQDNLDRLGMPRNPPRQPNEWVGFWDHKAVQAKLQEIRSALDSGVPTTVKIENAWHRTPNKAGQHYYTETLHIKPKTVVIFDAKYDLYRLPNGGRFDDMSVRITDTPANVHSKYVERTTNDYPDPEVRAAKVHAFENVIAPSYHRYLGIQQQYRLRHPDTPAALPPEDLILNVDLNYVPQR